MSTSSSVSVDFDAGDSPPPAISSVIFAAVKVPPMGRLTALPAEGRQRVAME